MNNKTTFLSLDFIVVIPCFNDKTGLIKSLQSIRYQNNNFAVLVIDDGSPDPIIVSDLSPQLPADTTIEIITLSKNVGITKALNAGLLWIVQQNGTRINCKYVARLDCGDLCASDRFDKQVSFLDLHQEIDLLGTWCVFEDFETGDKFVYSTPTRHKKIRRAMYFRNIFIHPTVMWRSTIMEKVKAYPEDFPHAEDYGLFYRWMDADVRTAVLPEKLVTCRISSEGLSLANRQQQLRSRMKVVRTYGRNKLLRILGELKLWTLIALPYSFVFKMKRIFAGVK
ncbi:MAG TPA: glycosyltransferase [Flavitalea sp.]|nr:glycosyltransferase [Flavitalea sp.]